ncbi:hypothetical protein JHK85_045722 [Glycine max]|nr:hypothetical protein JHK85_045722 [Glycine max]
MMDYVGSVGSLDATKIFLGQSFTVVRHWKEMLAKADKKTKVMAVQLKAMKENKTTEEDMASAEDEIANMKKTIEKIEEGFKKAHIQVKVLLPSFDSAQVDVNCDIVDGEIVREMQLCSESKGEEERKEVESK